MASAVLRCTILLYLIVLQDQMTGSRKSIGRIHVDICWSSFVAFGINDVDFYTAAYLKHIFDNIHPKWIHVISVRHTIDLINKL